MLTLLIVVGVICWLANKKTEETPATSLNTAIVAAKPEVPVAAKLAKGLLHVWLNSRHSPSAR